MANPSPNTIELQSDDSLAPELLPTVSRPESPDRRVTKLGKARSKLAEKVKNLERRLRRQEEEIKQEWQRRMAREGFQARAGATNGPIHHSMPTSDFIKKVPKFGSSDKREDDKLGTSDFRNLRAQACIWWDYCRIPLSQRGCVLFTGLAGRAAQLLINKYSLEQLHCDNGGKLLVDAVAEYYEGDLTTNFLKTMEDFMDFRRDWTTDMNKFLTELQAK